MFCRTAPRFTPARLTLAGLALAISASALSPALAAPEHGPGPMMFGGGPEQADRMVGHLLSGASNLSDAQRDQVREIARRAAAEMRSQHEAGRALREQMATAFAQPVVDAAAVEALRQKQLGLHDAASKRMTQTMLEISRVLTPEQRQQIAQQRLQRQQMMERHRHERQQLGQ